MKNIAVDKIKTLKDFQCVFTLQDYVEDQLGYTLTSEKYRKNPKEITTWINSVSDLHKNKPPPSVNYQKMMPEIDALMQVIFKNNRCFNYYRSGLLKLRMHLQI